ncbi:MAG: molybdopterin cofactor-binding domain-containing protein [Candidatus Brocadiia bacterium]
MTQENLREIERLEAALSNPEPGETYAPAELGMTRRTFLKYAGAGLLITVMPLEALGQAFRRGRGEKGPGVSVAARIHIGKDGTITVMTGKVEGGQGARAELTQAAAEELGLPPDRVQLVMADTDLVPDDGITAGSGSTPRTVPAVRHGAAAARALLIAFAARQWGVDAGAVEIRDGKAVHAATRRELTYADLAADPDQAKALQQPAPEGVVLTPVKEWKALGQSVARPNARDIVTGAHRYPSDMTAPGMLYGRMLRAPSYGAKLKDLDPAAVQAIPGAVLVREDSFIGVVAPTAFAAERAMFALARSAAWETADQPGSKTIFDYLRQHTHEPIQQNPFAADVAAAAKSLKQTYTVAYVQHAPMEPRTALAAWDGGKVTVWLTTQNPFGCRNEISRALGINVTDVRVIVPDFGGGFGGRHTGEEGVEAARLARAAGKPVLVRWTRREEFTWAYFRPAGVIDIEAGLDAAGTITSWRHVNISGGSFGGSAVGTPYRVSKAKSQAVQADSPLRTSSYRALAATANNFAREAFMDELAAAAGRDPLEFRLAHLDKTDDARLRAVLETAAKRFDWAGRRGKKEPGVGVGLACGTEKGSCVAACVEVAIEQGEIVVRRACEVFECGAVLNPGNLTAQVHGCLVMGIGPALREEMQFEKGVVLNASFSKYLVPRFRDVPELDIHLLDRPDLPSAGAGETPIIVIAPAIANAVLHATGLPIHQMPIRLAKDEKTAEAAHS